MATKTPIPEDEDPLAKVAANEIAPLLTPEEIEAAKAEARERVRAKAVKIARAAIIEEETRRLEREAGLHSGDDILDEEVPIFLDLPEFAPYVAINGERFYHGQTYVLPRHVANGIREQMFRSWEHERDRIGNSLAQKLGARRVSDFDKIEGRRVG